MTEPIIGPDRTPAAPPPGFRHVPLPGGSALTVRPVTIDDVPALQALYAGLSVDDLYLRFFSVYRPDRQFLERVATAEHRGGYGLVAVVTGDQADDRLVGEAGYELLPDGDGELAIVVAPQWRGWLGPYLLDALIEAAGARGVPNLEAEVLVSNGRMLSLVRSRGYVTLANDDWCTSRVLLGTDGPPVWPGPHDRPRVLVEVPGARWHAGVAAAAAGIQVLACPGPASRGIRCPALEGRHCPLVDGADAVVVSQMRPEGSQAALVDAHRRLAPGVPVCTEVLARASGVEDGVGGDVADRPDVGHVPAGEGDDAVVAFVKALSTRRPPR